MNTKGYYTSFNHQLLQNAVLYPKNGVRSVNLPIPAKTLKLMSYIVPIYLMSFSQTKLFRESMLGQHGILGNNGIDYANERTF